MISQWYEYKEEAISLRKKGYPIREVEKKLGIPRSTLSGWFKKIELTQKQKDEIHKKWILGLNRGRKNAVIWHNLQKTKRIEAARIEASDVLKNIDIKSKYVLELALSMLYLGEGSKGGQTSMGNSNPEILKFFIECLNILYDIKRNTLKCYLHLRSDQNGKELIKYWSKELNVPIENFSFTKDKRTVKSKTYQDYKGVCVVHCGQVAILRRLSFISGEFSCKILASKDS